MIGKDAERTYVGRWATAGRILEDIRWRELRDLDDARAREASAALIEAALRVPVPATRRERSGLIDQQDLLHRRPAR